MSPMELSGVNKSFCFNPNDFDTVDAVSSNLSRICVANVFNWSPIAPSIALFTPAFLYFKLNPRDNLYKSFAWFAETVPFKTSSMSKPDCNKRFSFAFLREQFDTGSRYPIAPDKVNRQPGIVHIIFGNYSLRHRMRSNRRQICRQRSLNQRLMF